MSEPEIIVFPALTLYVRTRLNSTGLHYAPAPVLEALRNTDCTIDLQILDLAHDKDPMPLSYELTYIRFVARRNKYPVDSDDIFVDLSTEDAIGISITDPDLSKITITIAGEHLNVAPSQYWYDLQIWTSGIPENLEDFNVRQPLQKFIVLP